MKQKIIYLVVIVCGILALYLNNLSRQNTVAEEATISVLETGYFLTLSVTPSITPSPTLNATTIFEHTAIAHFTENPEWALSSTPYYGEILYNHAISFITTTPTLAPSEATPECWLYAGYRHMVNFDELLLVRLSEKYSSVGVDSFVNYVSHTENCEDDLLVSNYIRLVFVGTVEAETASKDAIAILYELIPQETDFVNIPENININFYFGVERQSFLSFNWQMASQAYENGLEGEALIEALGGLLN